MTRYPAEFRERAVELARQREKPGKQTVYAYDPAGRLIQARGSDAFTFNYANQLTGATVGGVTSTSTYNDGGLRMSHTVGTSPAANYVWDVNRSVPEILQDGTNTYVYGLGRISSTDGSGNQTYYDADGLGSTSDLTDSSHAKTDGYTYDAFGTSTHTSGSSSNPFQFTGQQTDLDSGLQYLRARYYDPTTGRFLSPDPLPGVLGAPETQNRYPYALNNPATFDDPTGQWCHSVSGCVKSVTGAVSDVAVAVAPYAAQCGVWGAVGFGLTLDPAGAVVGCATGAGSKLWGDFVSSDPYTQCAIWAVGGIGIAKIAVASVIAGGAGGCAGGASSWLDSHHGPGNSVSQCAAWAAAGAIAGVGSIPGVVRGGLLGCAGGALGALADSILPNHASVRFSLASYPASYPDLKE